MRLLCVFVFVRAKESKSRPALTPVWAAESSVGSVAAAGAGADQVAVPEHCDINHPPLSPSHTLSSPLYHLSNGISLTLFFLYISASLHFFVTFLTTCNHADAWSPTCTQACEPTSLSFSHTNTYTHTHTACAKAADTGGFVVNSTHT